MTRALLALILLLCGSALAAQEESPDRAQPALSDATESAGGDEIVVATRHAPPFAIRDQSGDWSGIAIELWAALADELDLAYRLVEVEALDRMIEETAEGRHDAAVAALSITPSREQRVDFSFPYYSTGLGIAVNPEAGGGWLRVLRNLFTWQFAVVLAGLSAVLFIAGFAVWLFERRGNNEEFHREPVRGLGDVLS